MKRISCTMILLLLTTLFTQPTFGATYVSVTDNEGIIKYVYDVDDFAASSNYDVVVLMADLDLENTYTTSLSGSMFLGNGHTISNPPTNGIFSYITSSSVQDLVIDSPTSYAISYIASNDTFENIAIVNGNTSAVAILYSIENTMNNVYIDGGRLVELSASSSTYSNCFFNSDSTSSSYGTGLSTAQMTAQSSYTNWDFNNIWSIEEGNGTPTFAHYNYIRLIGFKSCYSTAESELTLDFIFNQKPELGSGNITLMDETTTNVIATLSASDLTVKDYSATVTLSSSLNENNNYSIDLVHDAFGISNNSIFTDFANCVSDFSFTPLVFQSGDGSTTSPYSIYSIADLDNVRNGLHYAYILMNDIDLSGESFDPIGLTTALSPSTPVTEGNDFTGIFDGNGFTISNFNYETTGVSYLGLFSYNSGIIKNLGVTDAKLNVHSVSSTGAYSGILVGHNAGTVENCYSSGQVMGRSNLGGLVGCSTGKISDSYSTSDVFSETAYLYLSGNSITLNVDEFYIGGLLGRNSGGTVSKSYATGNVVGYSEVGGLVGNQFNKAVVENSYATGNVTGYYHVGGLNGRNYSNSSIENVYSSGQVASLNSSATSLGGLIGANQDATTGYLTHGYYNQDTSGQNDNTGKGTPVTTEEMHLQSTYEGFDFDTDWTMINGHTYPYLKDLIPDSLPGLVNVAPSLEGTVFFTLEDTTLTGMFVTTDNDYDMVLFDVETESEDMTPHAQVSVSADGHFTYVPEDNFNGTDNFTVTFSDPFTTTSALVTVQVTAVKDALSVENGTIALDEDTVYTGQLVAEDVDHSSGNLVYAVEQAPNQGSLSLNTNGIFIYTPFSNFCGDDAFIWSVSENNGDSVSATVDIHVNAVNDAPVALSGSMTATYDETTTFDLATLVSDIDSTNLDYAISSDNELGKISLLDNNSVVSFSPDSIGTASYIYSVSDIQFTTSSTFVITVVNNTYQAPTNLIVDDSTRTIEGVTEGMEYKEIDESGWHDVAGNTIAKLSSGTYLVRYKATYGYNASSSVQLTISGKKASDKTSDSDDTTKSPNHTNGKIINNSSSSPKETGMKIDVKNGDNVEQIAANLLTDANGKKTVTVNLEKIDFQAFRLIEDKNIQMDLTGADESRVSFNATQVAEASKNGKMLSITTDQGQYVVPFDAIDMKSIESAFGEANWDELKRAELKIEFTIKIADNEATEAFDKMAGPQGMTVLSPLVSFNLTAIYNGQRIELHKFSKFVEHSIRIPDDVDAEDVTTGVVYDPDKGIYRTIPTRIQTMDGISYAVLSSMTNSYYALINAECAFTDVEDHWAESVINKMGAKGIVSGVGNNSYNPDADVTRAELMTMLVKALGLPESESETKVSWYTGYVDAANEAGIITSNELDSLNWNDVITREEAMIYLARVANLTAENQLFDAPQIADFSDAEDVSQIAYESVQICLKTGIISGRSDMILAPKAGVTRAEMAEMVWKLLNTSGLSE